MEVTSILLPWYAVLTVLSVPSHCATTRVDLPLLFDRADNNGRFANEYSDCVVVQADKSFCQAAVTRRNSTRSETLEHGEWDAGTASPVKSIVYISDRSMT